MTDLQDHELETTPSAPAPAQGTGSMLDRLRRQREAIGAAEEVVLDIPGHSGLLAARFRLLHFRELSELANRMQGGSGEAPLEAAEQMIQSACLEVLVRDPDSGELQPIDPAHGVTRFDHHLLDLFGIDGSLVINQSHKIVRLIFNRDPAVTSFAGQLVSWMTDSGAKANEEFRGK